MNGHSNNHRSELTKVTLQSSRAKATSSSSSSTSSPLASSRRGHVRRANHDQEDSQPEYMKVLEERRKRRQQQQQSMSSSASGEARSRARDDSAQQHGIRSSVSRYSAAAGAAVADRQQQRKISSADATSSNNNGGAEDSSSVKQQRGGTVARRDGEGDHSAATDSSASIAPALTESPREAMERRRQRLERERLELKQKRELMEARRAASAAASSVPKPTPRSGAGATQQVAHSNASSSAAAAAVASAEPKTAPRKREPQPAPTVAPTMAPTVAPAVVPAVTPRSVPTTDGSAGAKQQVRQDDSSSSNNGAMKKPLKSSGTAENGSSQPVAYVGFANLPHQVHRKSVKKGFEFTLMVAGETGLGKSTLVNSLFLTKIYDDREIPAVEAMLDQTVKIEASTVEIEEKGVKLRLTIVDTPGYGDALDCSQCYKPIVEYVDDQFGQYLREERGFNRRHITDTRVHACFYFISSSAHGLKPLDIEFMKAIHHKVNIVPVIAKSDMLTKQEIVKMKERVLREIAEHQIDIYRLPEADEDEDEEFKRQTAYLKQGIPFAVVGSTDVIEVNGRKVRGRLYPWGVVEVENPEHCDFLKLRTMLVTHMQDLQEVTHDIHYERYRAERLQSGENMEAPVVADPAAKSVLEAKDAELRRMQEMLRKMQMQMQQQAASGTDEVAPRSRANVISKQV